MRGSAAWTALAGIAWLVTLVATMFLALALWVGVDQGIQIMRGKAEFASAGFGKGVLTVLVLTVILCASVWVIAHRKSLREAEAERTGPSAAYASACMTAPFGQASSSTAMAAGRRMTPSWWFGASASVGSRGTASPLLERRESRTRGCATARAAERRSVRRWPSGWPTRAHLLATRSEFTATSTTALPQYALCTLDLCSLHKMNGSRPRTTRTSQHPTARTTGVTQRRVIRLRLPRS